jgi:hypothetical protein
MRFTRVFNGMSFSNNFTLSKTVLYKRDVQQIINNKVYNRVSGLSMLQGTFKTKIRVSVGFYIDFLSVQW